MVLFQCEGKGQMVIRIDLIGLPHNQRGGAHPCWAVCSGCRLLRPPRAVSSGREPLPGPEEEGTVYLFAVVLKPFALAPQLPAWPAGLALTSLGETKGCFHSQKNKCYL